MKDIAGALVEQESDDGDYFNSGFTSAIIQQGEVRLTLDREKTAKLLHTLACPGIKWEDENIAIQHDLLLEADNLNANLKDLIVVIKEKEGIVND